MARAERLIAGWLDSELRAELAPGRPRCRSPWASPRPWSAVKIDLLVPAADGEGLPVVVDYKTDALGGRDPAELGVRYAVQRQVYALAADAGRGARGDLTCSSTPPKSR